MSLLALMEAIDETNSQTASFALLFKDGANQTLALTGHGKGNPVKAEVTNGIFCLITSLYFIRQFLYLFYLILIHIESFSFNRFQIFLNQFILFIVLFIFFPQGPFKITDFFN